MYAKTIAKICNDWIKQLKDHTPNPTRDRYADSLRILNRAIEIDQRSTLQPINSLRKIDQPPQWMEIRKPKDISVPENVKNNFQNTLEILF